MNGEIYRLNIRFDLTDESQRSIAERLQDLDRKQYGSINKFIIAAIGTVAHWKASQAWRYNEENRRMML